MAPYFQVILDFDFKKNFSDRLDRAPEIFGYQQLSTERFLYKYIYNLTYCFGATQKTSAVCPVIIVS